MGEVLCDEAPRPRAAYFEKGSEAARRRRPQAAASWGGAPATQRSRSAAPTAQKRPSGETRTVQVVCDEAGAARKCDFRACHFDGVVVRTVVKKQQCLPLIT